MTSATLTRKKTDDPTNAPCEASLVERFGKPLLSLGFTAIPNLLLRLYSELGLKNTEALFVIHVLSFKWSDADPFPGVETLARAMNVSVRTIKRYSQALQTLALTSEGDELRLVNVAKTTHDEREHGQQNGEPLPYLVVTPRFATGRGQISNAYDLTGLLQATLLVARKKGLLSDEGLDTPSVSPTPMSPAPVTTVSRAPVPELAHESKAVQRQTNAEKEPIEASTSLVKETVELQAAGSSCSHTMTTRKTRETHEEPAELDAPAREHPISVPVSETALSPTATTDDTINSQREQEAGRQSLSLQRQVEAVRVAEETGECHILGSHEIAPGVYRGLPPALLDELDAQRREKVSVRIPPSPPTSTESASLRMPPSSHPSKPDGPGHWMEAPLFIKQDVTALFDDSVSERQLHASITRLHRLYEQTGLDEYAFRIQVNTAFHKARKAAVIKVGDNGRVNRLPYFFTCLEQQLGLSRPRAVMM